MDLGQRGVIWFTDTLNPAQLVELAERTEEFGYGALWYPRRRYESELPEQLEAASAQMQSDDSALAEAACAIDRAGGESYDCI
jgi:hypothetical protein